MNTKPKEFAHPYVTVDVLIFSIRNDQLAVLLIRRSHPPFAGMFAIPGGFVQIGETLDQAARRVIKVKGRQNNLYLEQLYTFGKIDRDPRGRVVSVGHIALVPQDQAHDIDDGKHVITWFPVKKLPPLAFDHKEILSVAVERIKSKIGYSSLAAGLLPAKFRFSELQKVYEIILGKPLDKRNFRKKMLSLGLLAPAGEKVTGGQYRPAMLYRFKSRNLILFN